MIILFFVFVTFLYLSLAIYNSGNVKIFTKDISVETFKENFKVYPISIVAYLFSLVISFFTFCIGVALIF